MSINNPQEKALDALKKYWGYDAFRYSQADIIASILRKRNVVGLLPTGAGKSICYQIPGIVLDGVCIVISPLIALMDDQVAQLKKRHIKAAAIHSGLTSERVDQVLDNCIYGDINFLYIAPERIQTEVFQMRLVKMNVSMVAIDEAHCISQWGHDFRPAYKDVKILRESLPNAPFVLFTATATKVVLEDILDIVELPSPHIFKGSFRKNNLSYTVFKTEDKWNELGRTLQRLPGVGIVYSRSRKGTEEIAKYINTLGLKADFYHAGIDYKEREKKQSQWVASQDLIMVCTNAFGMGIDKPDVRYVVHYELPSSLEEYYQEAGRAGRDGKASHAILLFQHKDKQDAVRMFEQSQASYDEVKHIYDQIGRFLQIPMEGGVPHKLIDFDVGLFSDHVEWPRSKVLEAIKILERNDLLSLEEESLKPSTIHVTIPRYRLYEMVGVNPKYSEFINQLFRLYEGVHHYPVSIDEYKLARALGRPLEEVFFNLKKMDEDGLAIYEAHSDLPKLKYHTVRLPLRNILIDKKGLERLQAWKRSKLRSMINYIEDKKCRELSIIHYFDEKSNRPCGKCDICRGSEVENFSDRELLEVYDFLKIHLQDKVLYRRVISWWPYVKRKRIKAILATLENEKKIRIDQKWVKMINSKKNY